MKKGILLIVLNSICLLDVITPKLSAQQIEEFSPCELRSWAAFTLFSSIKKYAAEEGITPLDKRLNNIPCLSRTFAFDTILNNGGLGNNPKPFPHIPHKPNEYPELKSDLPQNKGRIEYRLLSKDGWTNILNNLNTLDNADQTIPDILGDAAIAEEILNTLQDEDCNCKKIYDNVNFEKWKNIFKLIKSGENLTIYQEDGQKQIQFDDRVDIDQIDKIIIQYFDIEQRRRAYKYMEMYDNWQSTVMVIDEKYLTPIAGGKYRIKSALLKSINIYDEENDINSTVCDNVRFGNQPRAKTIGSGFFIDKNTVLTVAHLLPKHLRCSTVNIKNLRFIRAAKHTGNSIVVTKDQIYKPVHDYIASGNCEQITGDWAVIKVRPLGKPKPMSQKFISSTITVETPVYSVGYGLGLSIKHNFDGTIGFIGNEGIYANLDLFSGNSGSPVFDSRTNELIGILSGGAEDWDCSEKCCQLLVTAALANEKIQDIRKIKAIKNKSASKSNGSEIEVMKSTKKLATQPKPQDNTTNEVKRNYAPYVYFKKNTDLSYIAAILSPIEAGKTLVRVHAADSSDITPVIEYEVKDSTNSTALYFRDIVQMGNLINSDSIEIIVRIKNGQKTRKTEIIKIDADTATISDFSNNTIYNAPYIYLTKGKNFDYETFLLVPVKNNVLDTTDVFYQDNGGHKSEVTYTLNSNSSDIILVPINSNGDPYTDYTPERRYEAEVTYNNKKKRARLAQNNADAKPRKN